ncbi:hypothetical protein QQF40_15265 [Cobetia sp. LC6]|uniref:hypothetical protein n=1 Tax=Cobetia sp. LC6 TaxID=3050947 RepID=UPI002553B02B|nr:hypothetical protein [Cobetia sp. LC6]MDL2192743.1 hypothetical protein [Cobetia sp. LC6]
MRPDTLAGILHLDAPIPEFTTQPFRQCLASRLIENEWKEGELREEKSGNVAAGSPSLSLVAYRTGHFPSESVFRREDVQQFSSVKDLLLHQLSLPCARDLGLVEKCFILPGVGPLASARTAEWMRRHVPGMHIPD